MAGNKDWIETVKSLLERAAHPQTSPAEAESSTAMATRIMAKHRIDESMLGDKAEVIGDSAYLIGGIFVDGQIAMFTQIADAMDCRLIMIAELEKGVACLLVGHDADRQKFKMIDKLLVTQAMNALAREPVPPVHTIMAFATSFLSGFGLGVAERMKRQTIEAHEESGSALALIDKATKVDEAIASMIGPVDDLVISQFSLTASLAGGEAGRNSDVGDARVQNERKEIEA